MKFLNNPEIMRDLIFQGIIAVAATVIMKYLYGNAAASIIFIVAAIYIAYYYISGYVRYRKIDKISQKIDMILHGQDENILEDCEEGELAILSSEVNKMVSKLKLQTELLKKDKVFLADSIADISHQIKTPLTSINLILSFMKDENLTYDKRIGYAREIQTLTSRIEWLIYALLKLSRLDAGTVHFEDEVISLKELIDKSYELIEIPLDVRGISWKCSIDEGASMKGDMSWMIEAISNILKNCMEHTPAGGCIYVSCTENPLYSNICIEDTGGGIAPEDISHIFERFYKGSNSDENSVGIGLALAKSIIVNQNGTIKVYNKSSDECGAVFDIRFYKSIV